MKFTSLLSPRNTNAKPKLVIEGFSVKIFDKLRVRKSKSAKADQTEFFEDKWQVVDASGVVLREFLREDEAELYRSFIGGLKLHDVDQLIISLSKQLKSAHETINELEAEIRSLRKSLDGQ